MTQTLPDSFIQQPTRDSLLSIVAKTRSDIVSNWSGIKHICHTAQIRTPHSVDEIINIVKSTLDSTPHQQLEHEKQNSNNNEQINTSSQSLSSTLPPSPLIRIVGGGMSYEQIFSTDSVDNMNQIVLDMCNFSGLLSLNEHTATFGASTSINDIIRILAENDKMMTCSPGVIGLQTIAGALATGTHGQGMRQSCYADEVVSISIVLPDGRYVRIDEHTHLNDPTIPPLGVVVSALGTLGVVIEVEIRHAPRRVFTCRKFQCEYSTFLQQYQHWNNKVEFVKIWWFPETDKCHVWLIDEANELEKSLFFSKDKNPDHQLIEADMETNLELNDTVSMYLNALYIDTGVTLADAQKHQHSLTLQRFADSKDVIGYLEQIVCKGIPVPQINCEVAVPMSLFKEATELLHNWSNKQSQQQATPFVDPEGQNIQDKQTPNLSIPPTAHKLHYPFIYRATGEAKQACLYPSYGIEEGVAYIGFLVYLAADGSVRQDGMQMMGELQKLLATHVKGLPHMGKHFIPELYTNNFRNHKGLCQVVQWCQKLSPNGIFLNKFLRRVFAAISNDNNNNNISNESNPEINPSIINNNEISKSTNNIQQTQS